MFLKFNNCLVLVFFKEGEGNDSRYFRQRQKNEQMQKGVEQLMEKVSSNPKKAEWSRKRGILCSQSLDYC